MASPLSLDWSAPPECSERERILSQVRAILGPTPPARERIEVQAEARPTPGGRWTVRLVVKGEGQRELQAESCEAAADATALILALMIDPTRAAAAPPAPAPTPAPRTPSPAPAPAPAPPAPSPAPAPAPPAPSPAPAPVGLLGIRASVGGDLGTLSPANIGGELALFTTLRRVRLELAGTYWATATATASARPSEGADLGLATVAGRAGYLFAVRRLTLAPLVGVEGDVLRGAGFGGIGQAHQNAFLAAVVVGAMASYPVWWRLSVTLTVEGVVPLARPAFVVDLPSGAAEFTIERPGPVLGRAFLGVEGRIF